MVASDVLASLEAAGLTLRVDAGKLLVSPPELLTEERRAAIKEHRDDLIVELLRRDGGLRVIVAGTRTFTDASLVEAAIKFSGFKVAQVICGMAQGVDSLGLAWAEKNRVPVRKMPADWDKHGKAAGPIRNTEMAEVADALVLVWDGKSSGSADMLAKARAKGLRVHECVAEKGVNPFVRTAAGGSTAGGAGSATGAAARIVARRQAALSSASASPATLPPQMWSAWVRPTGKKKWLRIVHSCPDQLGLEEKIREYTRYILRADVLIRPDNAGDPNDDEPKRR